MTANTQDIINRLLNGELSEQEMLELRQNPEMTEVLRIVTEVDTWDLPESRSTEEAWESLSGKLTPDAPVRSLRPMVWIASAAAAIALLLVVVLPSSSSDTRAWETASAEINTISLPDGSEVVLNAGSQLATIGDWTDQRTVNLSGSALFTVEKGTPFIVATEQGNVQVLGTSFEVVADQESYVVMCFEGTVAVHATGLRTDTLTAGEGVRLLDGEWVALDIKGDRPEWMNGITQFEGAPLREVLNSYERQFGIQVEYIGDDRKYTGAFPNDNPNEALEMILQPMGLEIERQEEGMIRLRKLAE